MLPIAHNIKTIISMIPRARYNLVINCTLAPEVLADLACIQKCLRRGS